MSATDLVCLGESFEDLVFAGLARLPRLGEELRTRSFVRTFGGGATITAVAAARLGVSTRIVSGLCDGACARLRAEHVQVTNLKKRDELHAITAALSTKQDRAFATFDGVNAALGPRFVAALSKVHTKVVHCALCPRDMAPFIAALQMVRARGIAVSLDFGYDLDLAKDPLLPRLIGEADFLLINEAEARLYSGCASLGKAELFWKKHAKNTVIKLGAKGSRWISPEARFEESAPKVQALDTTGAGDAFNAGFLAGVLSGLPARRALRLGNSVGARSTRTVGGLDGLPRLDEL